MSERILVVALAKGYVHSSIPLSELIIEQLKPKGWTMEFARIEADVKAKMTASQLRGYRAVVLISTTGRLPMPNPKDLIDYVSSGHGLLVIHAAIDTFNTTPGKRDGAYLPFIKMMGGEFKEHHTQCAVAPKLVDGANLSLKLIASSPPALPEVLHSRSNVERRGKAVYWRIFDEIYIHKNVDWAHIHPLLVLDRHPNDGSPQANHPGKYPLAWWRSYGKGKVFYTALGHREEVWRDPLFQSHIRGALTFVVAPSLKVVAFEGGGWGWEISGTLKIRLD